jgi:hypothetical protein
MIEHESHTFRQTASEPDHASRTKLIGVSLALDSNGVSRWRMTAAINTRGIRRTFHGAKMGTSESNQKKR